MKNLNQDDAKRICDKVLALTSADQCEVNLTGSRSGNIRYARNAVSTAGLIENTELAIAVAFGKKQGQRAVGAPGNIIMAGTNKSTEELIANTKKGVLVTRTWYIRMVCLLYTSPSPRD